LQLGFPLLLCQDSRSYPKLRPKELSSRTPGVRLHLTGPTVPDPLPARGRVRCHHVSQRWNCSVPVAVDPDRRRWVRDLHVSSGLPQMGPRPPRAYPDPRELSAQLAARGGSGAATCHADAGVGASLSLEAPSPSCIKCEWLRRALLPLGTGQLLSVHTVDRQLSRRLVSYQGKH